MSEKRKTAFFSLALRFGLDLVSVSASSTLRVGVVGCGSIVQAAHVPSLIRLDPQVKIVGVADPVAGNREQVGLAAGLEPCQQYVRAEDLLEKESPDVVLIATPHHLHAPLIRLALGAKVTVICEKPLAPCLEEARDLAELAGKAGVGLSVVHNFLYSEGNYLGLRLLERDRSLKLPYYGRSGSLFCNRGPLDERNWRQRADCGGGALNDTCYHEIYALEAYMGSPVVAVQGRIRTAFHGMTADDLVELWLEHESGATSSVQTSWAAPSQEGPFCEAHGTGRTVRSLGRGKQLFVFDRERHQWEEQSLPPAQEPCEASGHARFWQVTAASLLSDRPMPVGAERAVGQLAIIEAARRSAKEGGRRVELGEL